MVSTLRLSFNNLVRPFPLAGPGVIVDRTYVRRAGDVPNIVQHIDSNLISGPPQKSDNEPTYVQSGIRVYVQSGGRSAGGSAQCNNGSTGNRDKWNSFGFTSLPSLPLNQASSMIITSR